MKLRCLLVSGVVLFAVVMSVQSQADINAGDVVGVWLFNEGSGNKISDSSGNGHNGEKDGGIKWTDGKFGKALEFPGGSGDYASVPHDDSLSLATWTITVWVNLQAKDWQLIVQKSSSGEKNNNNYSLYSKPGGGIAFNFMTAAAEGQILDGVGIAVDDDWHHIATTFDGEVMYLYIDGEFDAEKATDAEPMFHDDPLVIGGDDRGAGVQVQGLVDEVGLFNRALSEEDVQSIMDDGLEAATAVSAAGKLATTWGNIRR